MKRTEGKQMDESEALRYNRAVRDMVVHFYDSYILTSIFLDKIAIYI